MTLRIRHRRQKKSLETIFCEAEKKDDDIDVQIYLLRFPNFFFSNFVRSMYTVAPLFHTTTYTYHHFLHVLHKKKIIEFLFGNRLEVSKMKVEEEEVKKCT